MYWEIKNTWFTKRKSNRDQLDSKHPYDTHDTLISQLSYSIIVLLRDVFHIDQVIGPRPVVLA